MHEIQIAFDNNLTVDVRDVFLDISKAFDKSWYESLLFKIKHMALKVSCLDFLKQRVVLDGQTSERRKAFDINNGFINEK